MRKGCSLKRKTYFVRDVYSEMISPASEQHSSASQRPGVAHHFKIYYELCPLKEVSVFSMHIFDGMS